MAIFLLGLYYLKLITQFRVITKDLVSNCFYSVATIIHLILGITISGS